MESHGRKPRILVVDDEPITLALAAGILEGDYEVLAGAGTGKEGLLKAREEKPDLIITDIVMPEGTGYDLCRSIKEDEAIRDIPVVFMSGEVDLDEYLAGHDVEGEDFLPKPFEPAELRHLVSQTLSNMEARHQLARDARSAFSTAMVAMSSAAELGVVLQFIRNSYGCRDYATLADAVVAACADYGLSGCVRLKGRMGDVARNRKGDSSPLERGVLERMSSFGRIMDFKHRTSISYPHVTVMITDMPLEDGDRYGRLRDHLMVLAESADARVQALDDSLEVAAKHHTLSSLLSHAREALADIGQRHRNNKNDTRVIMHTMLHTVEQSFAHLHLTSEQEDYLAGVMHGAVRQVMDLFEQGLAIDDHLSALTQLLKAGDTPAREGG